MPLQGLLLPAWQRVVFSASSLGQEKEILSLEKDTHFLPWSSAIVTKFLPRDPASSYHSTRG